MQARVSLRSGAKCSLKVGDIHKFGWPMDMAFINPCLVREIEPKRILCDTRLQCTLDGIPRKVIRAAVLPGREKNPRLS